MFLGFRHPWIHESGSDPEGTVREASGHLGLWGHPLYSTRGLSPLLERRPASHVRANQSKSCTPSTTFIITYATNLE